MDEHGSVENAEDDVDLPFDVCDSQPLRSRGYEMPRNILLAKASGTNAPSAVLKAQLDEVARATALPRTRSGYNSGG